MWHLYDAGLHELAVLVALLAVDLALKAAATKLLPIVEAAAV